MSNLTLEPFLPTSDLNERRCSDVRPVQDEIVEEDEEFIFELSAGHPNDMFVDDMNDVTLTIVDDDGT